MILDGFGITGFRSFDSNGQTFQDLSKVNVLIGKNNAGKSNVVRFLNVLPHILSNINARASVREKQALLDPTRDAHIGGNGKIGFSIQIKRNSEATGKLYKTIETEFPSMEEKIPNWSASFWMDFVLDDITHGIPKLDLASITSEIKGHYPSHDIQRILQQEHKVFGGNEESRLDELCKLSFGQLINGSWFSVEVVPAYRQVTADGDWQINGAGLVAKLNELKQPVFGKEQERAKFEKINRFVRDVLGEQDAVLDIPYTVDELYVEIHGRRLPLESLGTGVHQVIILAAASTILENTLICIEEPEIYLHPELQRKLVDYVSANTDNQYVLASHSSALLDIPGVNVYRCKGTDGHTESELALSTTSKYYILDDLGIKPGDILQSNCIVWVEGPSDRIYINSWLHNYDPTLKEGLHYSIMFYGGKLLSHLSAGDDIVEQFIALRRMNRHVAIIIDSDRKNKTSKINATKSRIIKEILESGGHKWVTSGKEIENYIPENIFQLAVKTVHGDHVAVPDWGKYKVLTKVSRNGKEVSIDKVKVARLVVANWTGMGELNFKSEIESLSRFIRRCNNLVE